MYIFRIGKPAGKTYDNFVKKFDCITEGIGKKQYVIPYLMSSHPGSTIETAIELAEYLRDTNYQPEQVQDFYPTPGTLATTMFYTGLDPLTMEEVYVPKTKHEKAMQRALLQYKDPMKYDLVYEALLMGKREDLIGYEAKCLIKPRRIKIDKYEKTNKNTAKAGTKSGVKSGAKSGKPNKGGKLSSSRSSSHSKNSGRGKRR